jgi:hypothetical protein
MPADEPTLRRRLEAKYRQVRLRDEVREQIRGTLAEGSGWTRPAGSNRMARRWLGLPSIAWGAMAVAFAAGALVAWGLRGRGSARLDAVVSGVAGQAVADGVHPLGPRAHVREGQRLHTSAASTVEAKVGAHVVAVNADSDVVLESLRPRDLRFRLDRGSVRLTVAPLERNGRLRIFAGELSVEVVGTVFEVRRAAGCSSVAVRAGRVATWFQGATGELRAGDQRRFCDGPAPVPTTTRAAPSPSAPAALGATATAKTTALPAGQPREQAGSPAIARLVPAAVWPAAEPPSGARLSDEERMFRDAARTTGDPSTCAARLQEYLTRFPNGMFVEDALYRLIRDSYAAADSARVVDHSRQFLRRFQRGGRAREVRLLYVHSLIESGAPPAESFDVLASLLSRLDSLPGSQQEQANYLAVVAYCGARRPLCRHWADRYLDRYPRGLYAAEVRRLQTGSLP